MESSGVLHCSVQARMAGRADATLFSLLELPGSNQTWYQCGVEVCEGSCPTPDCSAGQGTATPPALTGQGSTTDSLTAATSIFLAGPGSGGAVGVAACLAPTNPSWLKFLTIAFGVLFAIMLFINVFLCSAMTCSCTRTEVIEKEVRQRCQALRLTSLIAAQYI